MPMAAATAIVLLMARIRTCYVVLDVELVNGNELTIVRFHGRTGKWVVLSYAVIIGIAP